ncbi:MAG: hypothetical protein HYZ72_09220 [Deltaproteobacteria bacterium]|nr:hypothetical protein [Deltaproteobacteria bacterium]
MAEAYWGLGNPAAGREHLQQALALLGWPAPTTRGRVVVSLLRQVLLQVLHRLWPARFAGRSRAESATFLEATRAYMRLFETYWFANEMLPLVHACIRALNLAENAGPSPELARAYAVMCVSAGSMPQHALAEMYGRRALETAHRVNQLPALAYALFMTGLYAIGVGQWARVQETLDKAAELFQRVGDRRLLGDTRTVLGMSALYQGEFKHSVQQFADVHTAGLRNDNIQHQVWGLIGKAEAVFRLGQIDEAVSLLETVLALLAKHPDRAEELRAWGLLAVVRLRRGEYLPAQQAAEKAAHLIAQLPSPTSHYLLEGYAGVAEVHLALWEVSSQLPAIERRALVQRALHTCAALRRYAGVFPIGQPRAWLWQGWAEWLAGRPARAWKAWRKSLAAAERLAMTYEQGLAQYELGRHFAPQDPARQIHLVRACELFTQLGATYDLTRAQAASESQQPERGDHLSRGAACSETGSLS